MSSNEVVGMAAIGGIVTWAWIKYVIPNSVWLVTLGNNISLDTAAIVSGAFNFYVMYTKPMKLNLQSMY